MNLLLVVRSEILAIIISLFFIVYDRVCARYREGKDRFFIFALTALGHAALGLITEITVNSDTVAPLTNDILHVLFFAFALLFSLQYFKYVLSLIMPRNKGRQYLYVAYALCVASIIVMIFSPIDYLQGNGTKYSAGTGPTLCYMLGFVLFVLSDIVIVVNRRKIDRNILYTILPLSILGLSLMVVQILIAEFLFTGSALTIIAVGVFFSIENPIGKFRDRAFIDQNTGVWNRNCYEYDLARIPEKLLTETGARLVYVLGDINGLKRINDNHGHLEGDRAIEAAARILEETLTDADKIYRIGGDEFAAFYRDTPVSRVEEQLAAVSELCARYNEKNRIPVTVSLGYAEHFPGETMDETVRRADLSMYERKTAFYKENGIERT